MRTSLLDDNLRFTNNNNAVKSMDNCVEMAGTSRIDSCKELVGDFSIWRKDNQYHFGLNVLLRFANIISVLVYLPLVNSKIELWLMLTSHIPLTILDLFVLPIMFGVTPVDKWRPSILLNLFFLSVNLSLLTIAIVINPSTGNISIQIINFLLVTQFVWWMSSFQQFANDYFSFEPFFLVITQEGQVRQGIKSPAGERFLLNIKWEVLLSKILSVRFTLSCAILLYCAVVKAYYNDYKLDLDDLFMQIGVIEGLILESFIVNRINVFYENVLKVYRVMIDNRINILGVQVSNFHYLYIVYILFIVLKFDNVT
jgi:hypothetical protein